MPDVILVPLKDLQHSLGGSLLLDYPQRCSRCGTQPAEYFESHDLRLRAGQKRGNYYRPRYEMNQPYQLKIRVCRDCYECDYLSAPEALKHDATSLGMKARWQSIFTSIGGTVAAIGVLLVTPIVPAVAFLKTMKNYWQATTLLGLLIVLCAWLIQRGQQKRLLTELNMRGIEPAKRVRADVRTPILPASPDSATIPLEISITDKQWAQECAEHYHWEIESHPAEQEKGEEK